jgi:hypothetical protein
MRFVPTVKPKMLTWIAAALVGVAAGQPVQTKAPVTGYDDTPMLPDQPWRVHDGRRPRPRIVIPGADSTQQRPGKPPSDAIVLFDGRDLSRWRARVPGQSAPAEPRWKVENGYMEVVPGTGALITKEAFGDCQLHVEWATPENVSGSSQGRGNSGVLLMSRYEVQILDSWENITYADGQAAALYGQSPPLVNASRKPGEWQTFDIIFEAPRFEGTKLLKPAYVTVLHNGVVTHHRKSFIGRMQPRQVGTYEAHGTEEPLMLQNHKVPVRYRNIWIRRLGEYDTF